MLAADLGQLAATVASFEAAARAKDRRTRQTESKPSRPRRTSSRPCRSASTCAPSSSSEQVGRQIRGHRRHRNAAISDHPAREAGGQDSLPSPPGSTSSRATPKRPSSPSSPTTPRSSARPNGGRGRRAAPRQGRGGGRSSDAARADRGTRAILDHHQCRPGRRQRPGDHAHRAGALGARDRGLCAQPRHRLHAASARRRWSRSNPSPSPATARFNAQVDAHRQGRDPRARRRGDRGRSGARLECEPASPAPSERRTWSSRSCSSRTRRRSRSTASTSRSLPGMAVTVELKTGARRMLEYLFAPLVEVASRAMRER